VAGENSIARFEIFDFNVYRFAEMATDEGVASEAASLAASEASNLC